MAGSGNRFFSIKQSEFLKKRIRFSTSLLGEVFSLRKLTLFPPFVIINSTPDHPFEVPLKLFAIFRRVPLPAHVAALYGEIGPHAA